MPSLQDLINLAKADGGKFFVIDETGEAKLIIMPIADYQKLLLSKLQRQVVEVEDINQEILKAQLTEDIEEGSASAKAPLKGPTIISKPANGRVDLRAEVIDPSFDFEGPKVEIDDL